MGHKSCPECAHVTGPASKKCPSCGFDFGIFVQKSPGPRPRSGKRKKATAAPSRKTKRTKTPESDSSEESSEEPSAESLSESENEQESVSAASDDEASEAKAGPKRKRKGKSDGPLSNAELMARFKAPSAAPSAEKNLQFLSPEDQERVRSAMQARGKAQAPAASPSPSPAPLAASDSAGPAASASPSPAASDLLLAPELAAKHANARNGVNSGVVVLEADNFDDHNDELCWVCRDVGVLLCCDYCPKVFHKDCAGLSDDHSDRGLWECPECVRAKKMRNVASKDAQLASMGLVMIGMTEGTPSEPLVLDERRAETVELDSFLITAFFPALPLSVVLANRKRADSSTPSPAASPSSVPETKSSPAQPAPSSTGSAASRTSNSSSTRPQSSRGLFAAPTPSPQRHTRSLGDSAPVVLSVGVPQKS